VQRTLAAANLIIAFIATTAPLAHVLELPSKMSLGGSLWLQIQQGLYRGWGPIFGPIEIAALFTSLWIAFAARAERPSYLVAAACYGSMLVCFFSLNDPVNKAVSGWTIATLPPDWPVYRTRWETGHALSALLSVAALIAIARANMRRGAATSDQFKREKT
jgi:hypothetical protein